jgi:hypothetical protein
MPVALQSKGQVRFQYYMPAVVFKVPYFTLRERCRLIENNRITKYFFNRPNTLKLSSLFNKKKPEAIRKLCKLIDIINKKISSP